MTQTQKSRLFKPTTILIYGMTGAGKSVEGADLAFALFEATKLKTRLYLSDNGSDKPWEAVIDAGIVELVDLRDLPHPFLWAQEAAAGKKPKLGITNPKTGAVTGKWEVVDNSQIGMFVYDSLTGTSERMLDGLRKKAAQGINIGGDGAMNFTDGDIDWGGVITMGSNNRGHYMAVFNQLLPIVDQFSQLAVREQALVLVTAGEERGEQDTSNKGAMIGPKLVGKAMTSELPSKFGMTFHQTLEANMTGGEPGHKLWMVTHAEKSAGNMMALANRRLPMLPGSLPATHPAIKAVAESPTFLTGKNLLTKALQINADITKQVVEAMK